MTDRGRCSHKTTECGGGKQCDSVKGLNRRIVSIERSDRIIMIEAREYVTFGSQLCCRVDDKPLGKRNLAKGGFLYCAAVAWSDKRMLQGTIVGCSAVKRLWNTYETPEIGIKKFLGGKKFLGRKKPSKRWYDFVCFLKNITKIGLF